MTHMDTKQTETAHWFACRIFFNKLKVIREQLEEDGIHSFSPVRLHQEEVDGEVVYREEYLIPSLLFIHCTVSYLTQLRTLFPTNISFYRNPGTTQPAVIPDAEMEIFQHVTTKGYERLDVIDEKLVKGSRVRITGGPFKGDEGYIIRVHGTKRFVVTIKGVAAIATTFIPRCFIEKIE